MRHSISMVLLGAGIVLSLVGCQKAPSGQLAGKSVRFTASSSSSRAETRAVFSGDGAQDGTNTDEFGRKILSWERIDWEPGDEVMIASDKAKVPVTGQTFATYTVANGGVSTSSDKKRSLAKLDEKDGSDELFFTDETSYSFWGVYPAPTSGSDIVQGLAKFSFSGSQTYSGTPQTKTGPNNKTLTILPPDLSDAVMLAKVDNATSENVQLDFYPAFTVFEFTLMAKDADIDLHSLVIGSSKSLTGSVVASIIAGEDELGRGNSTYIIQHSTLDKEITYTFPANTQITKTNYLSFTVLTLPEDIEGLTLAFHMGANGNQVQKATLKQNGNPITFAGCKKHCLRGIAVKGGWQFELEGNVLDWDYTVKTTDFSHQVQANPFSISNAEETSNHYMSNDPAFSYEAFVALGSDRPENFSQAQKDYLRDHPSYQYRYYQVRTLLKNPGYFEVVFRPIAPLGGYWILEPEGDINMFDIVILDVDAEHWDPVDKSYFYGQIMNHDVTFRLMPSANVPSTHTQPYSMLFKAYFSPNIDFEPALSADSEIQDVHGAGDFSYWLFTIPANN